MNRTMRLGMVLVMAAVALGCDEKKEEAKPAAPVAAAATPTPAPAPTPAVAPAAPATPGAPGSSVAALPGDPAKALAAALNAAADAKGGTACEQAYNAFEGMMKAMAKSGPPGGKTTNSMPPKDKFLAGCKELPPNVQQCMVLNYAMAHGKECQEAQQKMDPATAAKAKALMGK